MNDLLFRVLNAERPRLIGWLKREFHFRDEEAEDCVQEGFLNLVRYMNPSAASLRALVRQRAVDRCRRRTLEEAAFIRIAASEDEVRLEDLAQIVETPDQVVQLNATAEARKTLLSDAVRAWTKEQTDRGPLGCRDKQIIERVIRGEDVDDVAVAVLGEARGASTIYQVMVQFRDWLVLRLGQPDIHHSVVATFVERDANDRPVLKPKRAFELLRWVVVNFQAMCPSRERLAAFNQNPTDLQFADVRYHVQLAPSFRAVYSSETIAVGCADCQRHPARNPHV